MIKAVRVHEHGGIDKVVIDDLPDPSPEPDGAVVEIKATSLNHLDIWVRNGIRGVPLPITLGSDGAGYVREVGKNVTDLHPGDRVLVSPSTSCGKCDACAAGTDTLCSEYKILGEHCNGTDAELISVKRSNLFKLPDEVTFRDAASLALVFITAYQMLVDKARIQNGESVLVLGAGSGVGTTAIQIARLFGARVIAVAGNNDKLNLARSLGANDTINYNDGRISEEVRRLTGKEGVDIVFEHTGKLTWPESILSARRGGRIVTCGATTGFDAMTDLRYVFARQLTILGSTMGSKSLLQVLIDLLSRKRIKSVIYSVFHFTEVRKAQEMMENRAHFGKIVLEF